MTKDDLRKELMNAIDNNHVNEVREALKAGADPNSIKPIQDNPWGIMDFSAFHEAVYQNNDIAIMDLLFKYGADIDQKNNQNGNMAMHYASSIQQAQWLLDHGADINAKNDLGETPILCFCYERENMIDPKAISFIKWMLEHGADPNIASNYGTTVFTLAGIPNNILKIFKDIPNKIRNSAAARSSDNAAADKGFDYEL